MTVDWPTFMRRKAVEALASAAAGFGTTVVAVNRPLCPLSTIIRKRHRVIEYLGKPRLERLNANLYLYSPRYFIHDSVAAKFNLLRRMNIAALRMSYRHLCRRIGIREEKPLIWFHEPQYGYLSELLPGSFNVLEIMDSLGDLDGNELERVNVLEEEGRAAVDLFLCTSQRLFDRYAKNYKMAWRTNNGIDRESYRRLVEGGVEPIREIASIPSPRIGYTGVISRRLDWNLIAEMAVRRPNWNFVFVGKAFDDSAANTVAGFDNIRFPGWYDHRLMPSVLRSLDIGCLPYRDTEYFRCQNPLKFYEFAAAGLKTVSSNMEEMSKFPDKLVRIVPNRASDWIDAIQGFLDGDADEGRRLGAEVAGEYIWEDMALKLLNKIAEQRG